MNKIVYNEPPKLGYRPDPVDLNDWQYDEVYGAAPKDMPDFNPGYDVEFSIGPLRDEHQGLSLRCFPGKTKVLMEDLSYRKIVDIRPGDIVFTHKGNKKRVTERLKRKWQGNTYKIKCWGIYKETEATPEHPFFTKDGWKEAKDLTTKDYIGIPTLLNYEEDKTIYSYERDRDFLWVLGLYLAEGSVSKYGVYFGLNSKETKYADKVKEVMAKYGAKVCFFTSDKKPNCLTIYISGQKWSKIFKELGGKYCDEKRINKRLLSLNPKLQMNIFFGWKDGDGHQDGNRNIIVTTSKTLLWQMHHILLRNCTKGNLQKRKKREDRLQSYVLEVNENPTQIPEKDSKGQFSKGGNSKSYFEPYYRFAQIRSIEKVPAYMGENVYNLEVEDDNSYIVNSLGVHNCVSDGITHDGEMAAKKIGIDIQLSQLFVYSQIRLPNGGSSPRTAYKLFNKVGIPEDKYMPTPHGKQITEKQMSDKTGLEEAKKHAGKWKIKSYYSVLPNIDKFAQAIYTNNGIGFGYIRSGRIGHFVFATAYGIHKGYRGIRYQDSYDPYNKWMIFDGKVWKRDSYNGPQVKMYSGWVSEMDWAKNKEKAVIEFKLERIGNTNPILWIVEDEPIWIKNEKWMNALVKYTKGVVSWDKVDSVDKFSVPYQGAIMGDPDFKDVTKFFIERLGKIVGR